MRSTKQLGAGLPSQIVVTVIGGTLGDSAAREGVTEAARRLSHALAEITAVLDTDVIGGTPERYRRTQISKKAKDVLKEWGVA